MENSKIAVKKQYVTLNGARCEGTKEQEEEEAQKKAWATKLNKLIENRIQDIIEDIEVKAAKGETHVFSCYYERFSEVSRGVAQHFRGLGYNVDILVSNFSFSGIDSSDFERESIRVSWGNPPPNAMEKALVWLFEKTNKMFF